MFTAMISRYHVLIALSGLTLALGVGWAAFELGRGRSVDAPRTVTSAPTAEQATGEGIGPQGEALPSPDAGAGASRGSDQGAEAPAAGPIEQRDWRQADVPQGQPQRPEAVVHRPAAEPDTQVRTPFSPGEPEGPAADQTAPPAASPAVPQAEPSVAGDAVPSPSSEDQAAAPAPLVGGDADEQTASPDRVAPRAAVAEAPADMGPPAAAPRQPSLTAPAQTAAEGSEPDEPAAQSEPDETLALAVPAPATRKDAPAPSPSAAPLPADRQALPDEPAAEKTVRAPEAERPGGEPRSAPARAADTLKRALATLFGGAADESVPPSGGADVAAVPDSAPAAAAPDPGSGPGDLEPGAAPSFDIVRVARGGGAVIAGRAAPGADVEIRSGDRTIDRVRADRRGEWVSMPPQPLAGGVQELSLAARVEGRSSVASAEVVVVAIPDPPPPELALPGADEAPPQLAAAQPMDEAFAVALPRDGAGTGRILQAPGRISSEGALALEMLDYDDAGRIRLSGEASAGAALRIYVDNEPAAATVVGPSGRWDAVLERSLRPGDYTLRLDQLGASGETDARIETPFTRVSQPPVAGDVQVDYVIVQPGNSLWRIARRVLGEGMQYVHIYEANQAQIRDPDLIYPGQVFELPTGIGPAG